MVLNPLATVAPGRKRRTVYDARHSYDLPGRLVRSEGDPRSKDPRVNEAHNGAGHAYDVFKKVFRRYSINDQGMRIDSTMHYGVSYDNAFWNGKQMVYGDGAIFGQFTRAIDVIGHELTHGIIQHEVGLNYRNQSGALNESFCDVFGSLLKQYRKH